MRRFIIERNIPGADTLSAQELQDISKKSNEVVEGLGEPYKWVTSYVAGDKIYCVHEAESAEVIRRHAKAGGFPADSVTEVVAEIDPSTATTPIA
jgi:Nickel responsive protein SCO4226-like